MEHLGCARQGPASACCPGASHGDALMRGAAAGRLTRVDVLQAAQHLVQEELVVLGRQVIIRLDDLCAQQPHSQPVPVASTGVLRSWAIE